MSEKEQITANILRAQSELEQALSGLEKMPAFDPGEIAYSAHTLNNYLFVTGCTGRPPTTSKIVSHVRFMLRARRNSAGYFFATCALLSRLT